MPDPLESLLFRTARLTVYHCDRSVMTTLDEKVVGSQEYTGMLTKEDLKELIESSSIEDVADQLTAFMAIFEHVKNDEDREYYAAYLPDGNLVGVVGMNDCHKESPEVHITIDTPFQRQGYGKELMLAILPIYLEKPTCKRILYRLRRNNLPSEKLVLSLGGELQQPASAVEELMIKNYYITALHCQGENEQRC